MASPLGVLGVLAVVLPKFSTILAPMLHITDGESVAGTLRESAIPGVVSTYGDLMAEGPAPAGLDLEAWIETRARFIADFHDTTVEEAL
jgi:hypothetical protein